MTKKKHTDRLIHFRLKMGLAASFFMSPFCCYSLRTEHRLYLAIICIMCKTNTPRLEGAGEAEITEKQYYVRTDREPRPPGLDPGQQDSIIHQIR